MLSTGAIPKCLQEYSLPAADIRYAESLGGLTFRDLKLESNDPVYYMYRDACQEQDRVMYLDEGIRYDITVIPHYDLGGEYIKTVGHFHPERKKGGTYPEYYEVIEGRALYLLQKNTPDDDVAETIFIEANTGDKVYIPPNYGHVTINIGTDTLVMCNLVEASFKSIYEPFQNKKGAAYFCLSHAEEDYGLVPNKNYKNELPPKRINAKDWPEPVEFSEELGLYDLFVKNPKLFSFLK